MPLGFNAVDWLLLLGRLVFVSRLRLPMPSLPGAIAGLAAGFLVAALVAALLLSLPLPSPVVRAASQSRFAPPLAAPALHLVTALVSR